MDKLYSRLGNLIDDLKSSHACEIGYMDSENCSWYHQNWVLLRKLELVSNPFWHEQFFVQQIKNYYNSETSSILVLGTADFSMPCLCENAGIKSLEISDICLTPLELCEYISKSKGYDWKTFVCDIRCGLPKEYDLIIDDAFLTRFDYGEKELVLKKISQALKFGGKYITTIRKGWNYGKALIPTVQEKESFVQKAISLAVQQGEDAVRIENAARNYIENMISYPIPNEEFLMSICRDHFLIEYIGSVKVPGECVESTYLEVVLSKRN